METPVNPPPRAFSLLELMVTLTIIAVIMSMTVYGYRQAIPHARSASCRQHLHELGRALQLYLSEHHDTMPTLAPGRASLAEASKPTLDTVLLPYLENPEALRCPADRSGLFEESGTSYFWNSLLNGQKSTNLRFLLTRDDSLIPVITDKEAFHKGVGPGVNILYADGRVEKDIQFQVGQ